MASDAPKALNRLGQSLWLDNITRDLLDSGTLKRYIDELSVTGLTSNPTIFDHADLAQPCYDDGNPPTGRGGTIGRGAVLRAGHRGPQRAADLFAPVHQRTGDGGRLGVAGGLAAAGLRHARRRSPRPRRCTPRPAKPNLFIKIPGTTEGLPAIEEAIFAGVPVNVTLLFSRDQYRGRGRCLHEGPGAARRRRAETPTCARSPRCSSAAGTRRRLDKVPAELRNKLGIAVAKQAYKAYRDVLDSDRWQRLANVGARPQRLLFASTGTKDPKASDTLYIAGAGCAEHGQHDAGGDPAGLCRSRQRSAAHAARRRRRGGGAGERRQGGHRHRRARRRNCRPKAPRGSSIPGANCLARSRPRARFWPEATEDAMMGRTAADRDRPGRRSPRTTRRSRICICAQLFADDPGRAERFSAEGAGLLPRLLQEPHHRRDHAAAAAACRASAAWRSAAMRCSPARRSTSPRSRAVLHVALRAPRGARIVVDGARCGARGPQGAGRDGGLRHARAQRRRGSAIPASASAT